MKYLKLYEDTKRVIHLSSDLRIARSDNGNLKFVFKEKNFKTEDILEAVVRFMVYAKGGLFALNGEDSLPGEWNTKLADDEDEISKIKIPEVQREYTLSRMPFSLYDFLYWLSGHHRMWWVKWRNQNGETDCWMLWNTVKDQLLNNFSHELQTAVETSETVGALLDAVRKIQKDIFKSDIVKKRIEQIKSEEEGEKFGI